MKRNHFIKVKLFSNERNEQLESVVVVIIEKVVAPAFWEELMAVLKVAKGVLGPVHLVDVHHNERQQQGHLAAILGHGRLQLLKSRQSRH